MDGGDIDPVWLLLLLVVLLVAAPLIRRAREEARKREEERQRREEERRRLKAELDAERQKILDRPVPPDILRDMREFERGNFDGEDPSPLAYVGYKVGKTHGLPERARHDRLDVCFRIPIPKDVAQKYHSWGLPLSGTRYSSMIRHLSMLADQRRSRRNYRFAVADWDADRAWFSARHQDFVGRASRMGGREAW